MFCKESGPAVAKLQLHLPGSSRESCLCLCFCLLLFGFSKRAGECCVACLAAALLFIKCVFYQSACDYRLPWFAESWLLGVPCMGGVLYMERREVWPMC
jgi:hypothetical protein